MSEIDFEHGTIGQKATIRTEWNDLFLELLIRRDICELELNIGKGWRGKSIEFLKMLPKLRSLTIHDETLEDIEPIHSLSELVELELHTYSDVPVDFRSFPKLENCGFEWIKDSDSLFNCLNLKSLALNSYNKTSSEPFSNLSNLETLTLMNSSLIELRGVFTIAELAALRIARLKYLTSLDGISALRNLVTLEIATCKRIGSIHEVFYLNKLKDLFVLNCGEIVSLKGIENLQALERVVFDETTNIADGDLTPIFFLKNLNTISFKNRTHYSHRREDFGQLYS